MLPMLHNFTKYKCCPNEISEHYRTYLWNIPEFDARNMLPEHFQFMMTQVHGYLLGMRHMIGKKSRVVNVEN